MNTPRRPTDFSRTQRPNEDWLALTLPEPALEPHVAIIDTHMHMWDHATGYRYFVEEYARDISLAQHTIESSVYIECRSMYRKDGPEELKSVGETEFAAGMAAIAASGKYTNCKVAAGIVSHADLKLGPRLDDVIEAHIDAANGRLRGIRNGAKWDADPQVKGAVSADRPGVYLEPSLQQGVRRLSEKELLFEASIFHPQISDVMQLARAAPDTQILVVNSGSPVGHSSYAGKEKQVLADYLIGMKELATCANVGIKLGGLLMPLANFDFGTAARPPSSEELAALWRPYIEPCIDLFGVDRCTVGSNFPVEKAGITFGTIWNALKRIASRCSSTEKEALFAGTARRVYRLS
jgi:predicted TIM-barrel fold metal-dependent hydrolase